MDFRILGALEVSENGQVLELGGGKQRALLTVLLLNAGEAVSGDRLIDALWEESPPANALNSVHIYVSRLRKVLGGERLLTERGGYRLVIEPGELDTQHFERLIAEGRERRAEGDAEACVAALRSALELWRGPPLADLAYETFAQIEISRLEELRLAALEEQLDAELELGRHAVAVPQLEALVSEYPLREHLRAQLMLALYRSGRQAEALDRYQHGRRLLESELGLEPGQELRDLQQEILNQDPALRAPSVAQTQALGHRRRLPLVLVAAGGAILVAAVAVVLAVSRGEGDASLAAVAPDAIGVVDPGSRDIIAQIPIAGEPVRLVSGGSVWVADDDSGAVSMIDLRRHRIGQLVATDGFPSDLALGEGALWVVDGKNGMLRRIDAAYGAVTGRVRVTAANEAYDASREGLDPVSVAAGLGSVWVTDGSSALVRVDPRTTRVVERIDLSIPLNGVAVGDGGVWVVSGQSATAIGLDGSGDVVARVAIVSEPGFESPYPLAVRVGEGSVWVLNGNTATVTRIDPDQRTVLATIPIGIDRGPVRLAIGDGAIWVANGDGTLTRVDADTNDAETVPVGHRLRDVAVLDGAVLVTAGSGLSSGVSGSPTYEGEAVQPLPATFCSPVYYGGRGHPQFLIASDLPLQGGGRTEIAQLSQAVQYVLRERGFRAGPFAVGYQSCDDSTAEAGGTASEKCEANAHAYAQNASVIGVIGPWNSLCAGTEIPILNLAPEGPLALISPSNTYVGLTRGGTGTLPGEPVIYYPAGTRNYVRLAAADDVQGAANAVLARRLGAQSVYVLRSPDDYGYGIASAFAAAGSKVGLRVFGPELWYPELSNELLVAEIKKARVDTVFLGTFLSPASIELIRNLRDELPRSTTILAPDGFSPPNALVRAVGPAAEGMTVSTAGLPNSKLPAAGRRFVKEFGDAVGQTPYQWPAAAAQAAEVLLAAIARSDGTRASVTRELFKTNVQNGILGDFSIDENGDTTAGAVTIYRIVRGAPRLFRVITPSPELVR